MLLLTAMIDSVFLLALVTMRDNGDDDGAVYHGHKQHGSRYNDRDHNRVITD